MAEVMSITRFDGKVLLATGGGSGIGAATARQFAAEGGRVAVLDLTAERAEQIAEELEGSIGIACDVSDESAVGTAVAAAVERLGRIDAVVNSAGYVHLAPIDELTLADWNKMLAVHLTGSFLVCKAALPALRVGRRRGDREHRFDSRAARPREPCRLRRGERRHRRVLAPART